LRNIPEPNYRVNMHKIHFPWSIQPFWEIPDLSKVSFLWSGSITLW
jgi:hypothetical protein